MPALLKRTMWAKTLGFIVSLIGFFAIVWTGNYADNKMIAWGIFLWYPLVGAVIGLAGTMDDHPLLGKMGIWRVIMLGAMMNFVLVLFAAEPIIDVLDTLGYSFSTVTLVWAAVLEGAII